MTEVLKRRYYQWGEWHEGQELTPLQLEVFDIIKASAAEGRHVITSAEIKKKLKDPTTVAAHVNAVMHALSLAGYFALTKIGPSLAARYAGDVDHNKTNGEIFVDRRPPKKPDGVATKGKGMTRMTEDSLYAVPDYRGEDVARPYFQAGPQPQRAPRIALESSAAIAVGGL